MICYRMCGMTVCPELLLNDWLFVGGTFAVAVLLVFAVHRLRRD